MSGTTASSADERTPMRVCAAFVAVSVLAITAGSDVSASEPREWAFQVFLEDKPIGRQVFRATEDGGERRVSIRADLDVKFFFINAYSYRHTNEEVWRDGCLHHIESTTDDNGTPFRVLGAQRDATFVVETGKREMTLEDCVWSFAYWDEGFLTQRKLLNSQTGEYEPVTATLVGDETIEFRGRASSSRGVGC